MPNESPWRTISSRVVHQTQWMTLYEDEVIRPDGTEGTYAYTKAAPFVLVVAHDGEHFVAIRQFRYPLQRVITEFPGGSIDNGEEPLDAAKRELREETGYEAAEWTRIGNLLNPNEATVFLAQNLTATGYDEMKEDGIAACVLLSRADIDAMIANDQLPDSKTLAALLLFERHQATKS